MKKTININLGGMVFAIDEDAYAKLEKYLNSLKAKFNDASEQKEIIEDIEFRFAELFSDYLSGKAEVVNIDHVQKAMATMGTPEEIEKESDEASTNTSSTSGPRRLFRDPDDKVIAGVLSGLAHYTGIDPVWWRLIWVILTIASIGIPTVAIYLILWLVVPKASTTSEKLLMKGEPVTLNSIEASVKKNLSSTELKKTSRRIGSNFGEILKVAAKAILVLTAIVLSMKLVAILFAFVIGTTVPILTIPADIGLIFPSTGLYLAGMISVFLLVAVPIALILYLCLKLLNETTINWGRVLGINLSLWLLGLIGTIVVTSLTLSNFKEESSLTSYINLPNPTVSNLTIDIPSMNEDQNFRVALEDGVFETEGYILDESSKQLFIDAVSLKIITSEDSLFRLSVQNISRGKNKADCDAKLENFINKVDFTNDSLLHIPGMVHLQNESEWRVQRSKYALEVPVGASIDFTGATKNLRCDVTFSGTHSKASLLENKWEMSNSGLVCLSCP